MFCITVNATLSGGLGPVCRASEDKTRQTRAICVCADMYSLAVRGQL